MQTKLFFPTLFPMVSRGLTALNTAACLPGGTLWFKLCLQFFTRVILIVRKCMHLPLGRPFMC